MATNAARPCPDALPSSAQLLGLDDAHVETLGAAGSIGEVRLHPRACEAFLALRDAAGAEGFDLRVASGFRSFARQASIWNAKARGERPVLDAGERPLDIGSLDEAGRVDAILLWSALPGCSRHHWGTDMDVVDSAALAAGAPLRLEARDWIAPGPFARLDAWLAARMASGAAFGLYRPYTGGSCGVAAEAWHLSYAPLAARCEAALDPTALRATLRAQRIELLDAVDARLDAILGRYVRLGPMQYPASAGAEETA